MKRIKKIGIVVFGILGLQEIYMQAQNQSDKAVMQDSARMGDSDKTLHDKLKDYLDLYEGFDLIKKNYKDIISFEDFMKMQGADESEGAFNNSIDEAQQLIAAHVKDKFSFELIYAMKYNYKLETITDPQFKYVMKYRDGFMQPIIKNWINEKDNLGETLLYKAVLYNNVEVVNLLLASQADPNIEDMMSANPLCLAVRNNNKDLVKVLLNAHAHVNVQEGYEQTPLHLAIKKNFIDIAELLIQAKADLTIQDDLGRTPLHLAIQGNKLKIVKMLLDAGADLPIASNTKDNAEQLVISPEMKALLEDYHAHQLSDEAKSV